MARKKTEEEMGQITFRCPVALIEGLKDLAYLSRKDLTPLLIELCKSFVDANKARITKFRQQAGQPIKMPTFDAVKKTATAVVEQGKDKQATSTPDEGGGNNAED